MEEGKGWDGRHCMREGTVKVLEPTLQVEQENSKYRNRRDGSSQMSQQEHDYDWKTAEQGLESHQVERTRGPGSRNLLTVSRRAK
jgi:hypothetical protein